LEYSTPAIVTPLSSINDTRDISRYVGILPGRSSVRALVHGGCNCGSALRQVACGWRCRCVGCSRRDSRGHEGARDGGWRHGAPILSNWVRQCTKRRAESPTAAVVVAYALYLQEVVIPELRLQSGRRREFRAYGVQQRGLGQAESADWSW